MPKMLTGTRVAVLGAVSGLLSGCMLLNPDARPPTETVPSHQLYHSAMRLQPPVVRPQVETVAVLHTVRFAYGSDTPSPAEAERLAAFLNETRAGERARIAIDGPRKAAGRFDVLTEARIAAVTDAIADRGLAAEVARRPIESLARPEDAIVVTVTRAMVIEPDCAVPKTIYGPRPTHIWSCSTVTALGRMVVDPLDLQRGRTLAPGDGHTLAKGVERYRNDQIKPLKIETTEGD